MKLLLAGPGTGKTTKVKEFISSCSDPSKVLVLSFTNATIEDLLESFREAGIAVNEKNCMTLHRYALRLNYQKNLHILDGNEEKILTSYSKGFKVGFGDLCRTLECITFEQMIVQTKDYIDRKSVV